MNSADTSKRSSGPLPQRNHAHDGAPEIKSTGLIFVRSTAKNVASPTASVTQPVIAPLPNIINPPTASPIATGPSPFWIDARQGQCSSRCHRRPTPKRQDPRRDEERQRAHYRSRNAADELTDLRHHHHVGSRRHLPGAIDVHQLFAGKPVMQCRRSAPSFPGRRPCRRRSSGTKGTRRRGSVQGSDPCFLFRRRLLTLGARPIGKNCRSAYGKQRDRHADLEVIDSQDRG